MTAWNESGPGNVGIENGIGLANDQNKVHEIEDAPEPPNTSITSCDREDNLITVHESFHGRNLLNDEVLHELKDVQHAEVVSNNLN